MKDVDGLDEECSVADHDSFVDGELIEDSDTIRRLCHALRCEDEPCYRCQNDSEPIAAILMLDEEQKAWLLCASCVRDLPREGLVV
jgi:hypothetical protein